MPKKTTARCMLALALLGSGTAAQEPMLASYEPNPAYPFGRRHPDAPPELEQFAFMIGECDCVDEIRGPDGSWRTTEAIWNASWFLDGWGIQDVYWSDTFATSNIRIFDPARGRWFVNFVQMPSPAVGSGQWSGEQVVEEDGTKMVMWSGSPDRRNGSRLTFYDISEAGFRWVAENLQGGVVSSAGWKSACVRRKPGSPVRSPDFLGYEPSTAHPLGRRNPDAPVELDQLAFLVGAFTTEESRWSGDEEWTGDGVRAARWVLNGWGIQERAFRRGRSSTSIALFDRTAGAWRVATFAMPDYEWSVWDGGPVGDEVVLRRVMANGSQVANDRVLRYTQIEDVYHEAYVETSSGELRRQSICAR